MGEDTNFNFSYNFNDINQLVFSEGTILGSYSINSAIPINPSIKSSVAQNLINLNYTDANDAAKSLQATVTTISIMKNNLVDNELYCIVLNGNIHSMPNANIYIMIPFVITSNNNDTKNSAAIEQIISSANRQIIHNSSTTTLSSPCELNNLITPGARYYYGKNNTFANNKSYNTTFVIFKDETGMISNSYIELIDKLKNGTINKMGMGNFLGNTFTPILSKTPISSDIMIDCSPVEITTEGGNVMFSTKDNIYGNYENNSTNQSIISFIYVLSLFIVFCLIVWQMYNMWVKGFVQQRLFDQRNE
jgi:hypothetical protein